MIYKNTMLRALTTGGALCGLLGLSTLAAQAQGDHPHYRHALTDLRMARAYLGNGNDRNIAGDERQALDAIDDAIEQLRSADIRADRDDSDRLSIDANLSHRDRLQKAATLIDDARRDLAIDEDHRPAFGWRRKALTDVNTAFQSTQHVLHPNSRGDRAYSDHPHYRQALADLRTARAYLRGDGNDNIGVDQKTALDEVGQAIGEIRRASIDDGRGTDYRPEIDTSLDRRARLQKAVDLITSARRALGFSEDDRAGLGWRKNAQRDLGDALTAAQRAMRGGRYDNRRDDRRNNN
ncbi:MAG: hypothetical protein JWL77_4911 [Chthonomonadaceae bacterium]|nr:hypothetical protein [Chthonomonadaceae bacterium]